MSETIIITDSPLENFSMVDNLGEFSEIETISNSPVENFSMVDNHGEYSEVGHLPSDGGSNCFQQGELIENSAKFLVEQTNQNQTELDIQDSINTKNIGFFGNSFLHWLKLTDSNVHFTEFYSLQDHQRNWSCFKAHFPTEQQQLLRNLPLPKQIQFFSNLSPEINGNLKKSSTIKKTNLEGLPFKEHQNSTVTQAQAQKTIDQTTPAEVEFAVSGGGAFRRFVDRYGSEGGGGGGDEENNQNDAPTHYVDYEALYLHILLHIVKQCLAANARNQPIENICSELYSALESIADSGQYSFSNICAFITTRQNQSGVLDPTLTLSISSPQHPHWLTYQGTESTGLSLQVGYLIGVPSPYPLPTGPGLMHIARRDYLSAFVVLSIASIIAFRTRNR